MKFDLSPHHLQMFRERSAQPSFVLRRKRCECNAVVTALQLRRFGKCDACVRSK